ncbi:hypothetical protein A9D60_09460 [Leisingera sp. JC1]|nr:hypothetical protein A9D60_09460 [Leisingera sp. JC1]
MEEALGARTYCGEKGSLRDAPKFYPEILTLRLETSKPLSTEQETGMLSSVIPLTRTLIAIISTAMALQFFLGLIRYDCLLRAEELLAEVLQSS